MNQAIVVFKSGFSLFVTSLFLITAGAVEAIAASFIGEQVVVANRGSGTLSVIDLTTDALTTIDLPFDPLNGESAPEPMYVFQIRSTNEVVVGDRANNRLVFFDQVSYDVTGSVEAGNGIFHMWGSSDDRQLWVNNDIDNTTTVIDPVNKTILATIPTPADLVAEEGRPHDLILDPSGDFAYITVLGLDDTHTPDPSLEDCSDCDITSVVLKYSTETFEEVARTDVGVDPHIGLTAQNDFLYIAAQNSNLVNVLRRDDLSFVTNITVPGAHGAGIAGGSTPNGRFFYTTNLPTADGSDGLFVIDTQTNEIIGLDGYNTEFLVPHNIAVTNNNEQLFITHSIGSLDPGKVTVYDLDPTTGLPIGSTPTDNIDVGVNPFGIFYVSAPETIPEPSAILGLFVVGSWGAGSLLKKKR